MKGVLLTLLLIFCALLVGLFVTATFAFQGPDHGKYDLPTHPPVAAGNSESPEHAAAAKQVATDMAAAPALGREAMMHRMREQMDARGAAMPIVATVTPVQVGQLAAEWVVAPNADPQRRMLYIHGGGYIMGSPRSHRLITSRMSEATGAVVLAIDYRLQPEHPRMAGIQDCRAAYRWLLENGPDTNTRAEVLLVAGDSSGGNLALSTIAWARDAKLQAADAVVVFAPQTDATLASPSLVKNIETDIMQGSSFGPIVKAPKAFSLSLSFLLNRINPRDPLVSPLLGDLANLPPTLVQVSTADMFLDDGVRYVNKANAQGSLAVLQTWPNLMHVWQAFQVPEADAAFQRVEDFVLTQVAPTSS